MTVSLNVTGAVALTVKFDIRPHLEHGPDGSELVGSAFGSRPGCLGWFAMKVGGTRPSSRVAQLGYLRRSTGSRNAQVACRGLTAVVDGNEGPDAACNIHLWTPHS